MPVRVDVRDRVAWITLDRPERHNAIDLATVRDVHAACRRLVDDPDVRCIALTGTGTAFCSGADLKDVTQSPDAEAWIRGATGELHPLLQLLHEGPKPTLTAINGAAAGGGLGLALAGDVRIAADTAKFRAAYFRIGLTPDGGSTYFVTRYGGLSTAQRLFFLEDTLDAPQALQAGLVHRVVPAADLAQAAHETAQRLASWSGSGYAATKGLMARAWHQDAATQMDEERREIMAAGTRADAREGIAAFVQKRRPTFS